MLRFLLIWLGSYLTIILFWNNCHGDLTSLVSNPQLHRDHPMRPCGKALSEGNLQKCISAVFWSYKNHTNWSGAKPVKICNNACMYTQKGRFLGWEWVWDTSIQCDSKAPGVVGEATKKSRTGSQHWAAKDFYAKAQSMAQFSTTETNCWNALK